MGNQGLASMLNAENIVLDSEMLSLVVKQKQNKTEQKMW